MDGNPKNETIVNQHRSGKDILTIIVRR